MYKLEELSIYKETQDSPDKRSSSIYIKLLIVGVFFIVLLSAFNLEVIHGGEYSVYADLNRLRPQSILADRGIIFDSDGTPLVYNIPSYKLYINNEYLNSPKLNDYLNFISSTTHIDIGTLKNNIKEGESISLAQKVLLDPTVSKDQMLSISNTPGLNNVFSFIESTQRSYVGGNILSHILGYTGQPSAADLKDDPTLTIEDSVGKDGIEYTYNSYLKGEDGVNLQEVNTLGQIVSQYTEQPPLSGNNLKLNINLKVDKALQGFLQDELNKDKVSTGGVAIVEDVNTGNIIGMVSLPTYNNNDFEKGISVEEYNSLLTNPTDPLLNRAIEEAQPPGSVMKTITAPAGLQEGAIDINTHFDSNGIFNYQGVQFQDYEKRVYGVLNVIGALKYSSNIFFFNTMINLGIDKFVKYEKMFGVGQLTGIDLPGEVKGTMSSPEEKQKLTGQVWFPGDSLNAAIGQGYTTTTPIQVVNWISAIANGGTLLTPHLVNEVISNNGNVVYRNNVDPIRNLAISKANLDIVRQGMYTTVHEGIDATANSNVVDVAGKTGTAEFGTKGANGYSNSHAWFAGYAPYQKPKIAMVVFLEGGGLSTSSAIVARNFFNWYFTSYDPQDARK